MKFSKKGNIYSVRRTTGSQDNILGIVLDSVSDPGWSSNCIEVIEWEFPNITERSVKTSKKEVLGQVMLGLQSINSSLSTNYRLTKIYFCPFDSPANEVYSGLIAKLIRHYHEQGKI